MADKVLTLTEIWAALDMGKRALDLGDRSLVMDELREIVAIARQGMMPVPDIVGFNDYWLCNDAPPVLNIEHHAKTWGVSQTSLLADPLVIDMRGVEWPEDATDVIVDFHDRLCQDNWEYIKKIPRPVKSWRPKHNEWVWCFIDDQLASTFKWNELSIPDERGKYAATRDFDAEKDWTWAQFIDRGDTWEVG